MRAWLLLVAFPAQLFAGESIEAFGLKWTVPVAADWKLEEGVLNLIVPRPSEKPRRPLQYALAQTPDYVKVTLEAEVRKEPAGQRNRRTSLILVYAWRDAGHFNYAHISVDAARQQPVHNGIFHVYGGDRVRISSEEGPGTLVEDRWQKVRLDYDARTGMVEVFVDGKTSPSLKAVDLSLGAGKVGLGSFFDLGQFRNVRITGTMQ